MIVIPFAIAPIGPGRKESNLPMAAPDLAPLDDFDAKPNTLPRTGIEPNIFPSSLKMVNTSVDGP